MARTVDDRVVSASFETSKFEAGTQKMISSLDKLKKSMDFKNAGKGLDQINASANRVNLSHIASGVDAISGKLGALRLTAIATFASIAQRGLAAAGQLIKKFTFAPVIDGLHEYENQLNSVQTILSNTKDQGTNLKDVNGALNQLNKYADQTIYNFGQMTKNVGTFTAAGVDLKTSVASIKGISNLAALSGSSAQQASTAMYQLSQAISAGRVGLQDWNSVVNAGMGGAVFQKSLMRTAENMGALKDGAVEIDKATGKATINGQSFRESIMSKPGEKSWLTGDVLTNTLKQLSGDMTDAQLKAEGFTDAQIKAIQSQSKMALDAATKIKTFSQLMDTTKEAIGSGWAQTWQLVLGDFGEAKKLFTSLGGAIGEFVKKSADARNSVLKDWKDLGGRTLLIGSLKNAFHALAGVVTPFKDAFRDIFPRKTGKDLFILTRALNNFTERLIPSKETVENLRRTFRGFFAILDIGKMIVGGIFHVIGQLFGAIGHGSGGFLSLTASMGDWLVALDESLKKGGKLNKFFNTVGNIIEKPIELIGKFGDAVSNAFGGDNVGVAGQQFSRLEIFIEAVQSAWDKFIDSISDGPDVIRPALDGISEMFGGIGHAIAEALRGASFDSIFKVIEVGLLGGIFLVLKKGLGPNLVQALSGGVLQGLAQALLGIGRAGSGLGSVFQGLTGNLQAMQTKVKSEAIRNIAISIALLSASIIGLSLVDPERLNSAMTAITIAFGQLLGAMAILDKIGKSSGFVKTPVIAASMILLAGAIGVLAISVFALSRLSWEELAKGLGAVSVLLGAITAATGPLSANSAGMVRAGVGLTVIAVAMNILAKAVKTFGDMDMATLAKGIGGIAVALAGIGAAATLFPSGMIAMGVGLVAIGFALKLIAESVQTLGDMDMATLGKGIGAIALALAGIGLAMQLMPGPAMVITAAGLLLVSVSLGKIAKVIKSFGDMSIEQIAKGLGTLAASLALLAIGLMAMSGTLGGSAALLVAATGIAILAPALKSLGDQSWGQIIKGLTALAAAFALLGIAGVVLAPVTPAILGLGVALVAVGAGLALAGAGVALIGIGLAAIAVAGPAAVKILVDALTQLALALPKVIKGLVAALLALVESVAKAAPQFVKAIGKIISLMAQAIVVAAPQLTKAFIAILELVFTVLRKEFPNLVKTGISMLKALLQGISKNIGSVVKMVLTIVGKFLSAIANNLGRLIAGGAQILAAILKGIAQGIAKVVKAAADIIVNFLRGISNNIRKVADAGVKVITSWLKAIADGAPKVLKAGTNVIVKFVKGIGDAAGRVVTAALKTVTKFISTVASQIPKEVNKVATAIIKMMNALAGVIRKREPEFIVALGNIGKSIVLGIVDGLSGLGKQLIAKVKDEIKSVPGKLGRLALKAIGATALPLPDGLGKKFGVTFTNAVIGELGTFEPEFQKELAKVGGAANIDFLFNLANDLATSFKDGLLSGMDRGEIDPIDQATSDIVKQIAGSQTEIENTILESNNKIRESNRLLDNDYEALRKARKMKDKSDRKDKIASVEADIKDHKAVRAEALKTLKANEQLLDILTKTSSFILLDPSYKEQISKLAAAKQNVKDLNDELEKQTGILEDLKQKRQSLFDQTFENFSTLPGIVTEDENGKKIDPADQVQNYIKSLSGADDVVGVFANSLDTLQNMGLNADTYQQLLDVGPAAQGFVNALIEAGPGAVAAINAADTDLRNVSNTLADHAASYLYDAGIKTTTGLIEGLKVKIPEAVKTAEAIATAIVKAIRKRLRVKSPSQVFAEIGAYSVEGLAQGFTDSSKLVTNAIYGVSDDAKAAIKKSMLGISDIVSDSIDVNPTITPVLDLSQIQAGANQIGSILPATASVSLASGISVPGTGDSPSETGQAAAIQFNQYNTSPESLSRIEIYRQTKNQLAQARPVLTK